jgi:hypothetical protein
MTRPQSVAVVKVSAICLKTLIDHQAGGLLSAGKVEGPASARGSINVKGH